jgi:hypothetical protein
VEIDTALPTVLRRPHARVVARVVAVPARVWLAAIVGLSCALRGIATFAHVTPYMLPDEYYYRSLAQSLATTGRPLVRGEAAHFPALLAPILTAPFQWFEPATAYHLTQLFDVAVMSLAAVPAFLLARRLGVGEWPSLGVAAVAVASPGMLYSGFILSEPLAYPLALTAVYAAVRCLGEPSLRTQAAFLAWAGLTVFARVQYIVLVPAFAGAALLLERLRAFRTWPLIAAVLAGGALLGLALGPGRVLGVYAGGSARAWTFSALLAWVGRDALLLSYSAGWILLPAGIVGLTCGRNRVQRAFAVFAALLLAGLLFEAAWVAAIDSARFEERYLILAAPLLAASFALWARHGAPRKWAVALATTVLLGFSMRVPLSGYVELHGKDGSPVLMAVGRLEQLTSIGDASLLVALAAAVLSLCLFAFVRRPQIALGLGFAAALVAMTAVSALAHSFDSVSARHARLATLPADREWVDHAGLGTVGLLVLRGSHSAYSLQQLFWNRSITRMLRLDAGKFDAYGGPPAGVSADGRILDAGGTFDGPLLVQADGSRATLAGATRVASGPAFELWKPEPNAVPRLAMLAEGLQSDGWLAARSSVRVWPDARGRVAGVLRLHLLLPRDKAATSLTFAAPGYRRTLRLAPGEARDVVVPVSQRGSWTIDLSTPTPTFVGLQAVSLKVASLAFVRAGGHRLICPVPSAPTI